MGSDFTFYNNGTMFSLFNSAYFTFYILQKDSDINQLLSTKSTENLPFTNHVRTHT